METLLEQNLPESSQTKEAEAENIIKKAREKLYPRIENMANSIKNLVEETELQQPNIQQDDSCEEIAEEYKNIILEAWKRQNEINEILNTQENDLPSDAVFYLECCLKKNANITGDKKTGYEAWFDANSDSKNKLLYSIWRRIEDEVNAIGLSRTIPGDK